MKRADNFPMASSCLYACLYMPDVEPRGMCWNCIDDSASLSTDFQTGFCNAVELPEEPSGGDGGIRTLDRALQPYNGLANRRLQPLGHVSVHAENGTLMRPHLLAQVCPSTGAKARLRTGWSLLARSWGRGGDALSRFAPECRTPCVGRMRCSKATPPPKKSNRRNFALLDRRRR